MKGNVEVKGRRGCRWICDGKREREREVEEDMHTQTHAHIQACTYTDGYPQAYAYFPHTHTGIRM